MFFRKFTCNKSKYQHVAMLKLLRKIRLQSYPIITLHTVDMSDIAMSNNEKDDIISAMATLLQVTGYVHHLARVLVRHLNATTYLEILSCIWIVLKYEDDNYTESAQDMVQRVDFSYSSTELIQTEIDVLCRLDWRLFSILEPEKVSLNR